MGSKTKKSEPVENVGRKRVAALELADRIARAKARIPAQDPTGECHEAIALIAERSGRDVGDLIEEWDERAACREYDGAQSRDEAERMAVVDMEAAYAPAQGVLLCG